MYDVFIDFAILRYIIVFFYTGAYLPGMHMQYGSEMALRMGRDSDRDSIISSEASLYHHDLHTLRYVE